eukprot:scaffold56146_cov59-Phaeocystis_antarctica.AAC.1
MVSVLAALCQSRKSRKLCVFLPKFYFTLQQAERFSTFYYLAQPKDSPGCRIRTVASISMPARLAPRGGGGSGTGRDAGPDEETPNIQPKTNEKREGDARPAELDNQEAMALRSQAAEAVAQAAAQAAASKR